MVKVVAFRDELCKKIFQMLATNYEGFGFLRLGREFKNKGFEMSRPTLSKHLKHLTEMELVTKEDRGIQGKNYRVNIEKYSSLKNTAERMIKLHGFLEEEKKGFYAKPLDQQISYVSNIMLVKNLETLKTLILCAVEPENLFENKLKLIMLENSMNDVFERWFLAKCKESPNYGKKAIAEIDRLMKNFVS